MCARARCLSSSDNDVEVCAGDEIVHDLKNRQCFFLRLLGCAAFWNGRNRMDGSGLQRRGTRTLLPGDYFLQELSPAAFLHMLA